MKIIGFIPVKYGSKRFPGKPLALVNGKSIIQRVYEQSLKSISLDKIIILTDDDRIYKHCLEFNANVIMTSAKLKNGTDRILSIINDYQDYDGFLNIQGDELFINSEQIDLVCSGILKGNDVTTLKFKQFGITTKNDVKIVCNNFEKALYFSRSRIPYMAESVYVHIGVYGFTKNSLNKIMYINKLSVYKLSDIENLEQLNWLENEIDIYAYTTNEKIFGIDTIQDLQLASKIYNKNKV